RYKPKCHNAQAPTTTRIRIEMISVIAMACRCNGPTPSEAPSVTVETGNRDREASAVTVRGPTRNDQARPSKSQLTESGRYRIKPVPRLGVGVGKGLRRKGRAPRRIRRAG